VGSRARAPVLPKPTIKTIFCAARICCNKSGQAGVPVLLGLGKYLYDRLTKIQVHYDIDLGYSAG